MKRKSTTKNAPGDKQIKDIFDKFSNGKQTMNDQQLFGFLGDGLELAADDPFIGYILTTLMKVQKMEQVKYEEFKGLFVQLKSKSINEVKKKIPSQRKQANYDKAYKVMYKKLFDLYIGNLKTLDLDVAEQLWAVYLKPKLSFYAEFQEYLAKMQQKQTKKVHRDLWNMMLQFSLQVANIQRDYNQDDGWPTFIDNFVQFLKQKAK